MRRTVKAASLKLTDSALIKQFLISKDKFQGLGLKVTESGPILVALTSLPKDTIVFVWEGLFSEENDFLQDGVVLHHKQGYVLSDSVEASALGNCPEHDCSLGIVEGTVFLGTSAENGSFAHMVGFKTMYDVDPGKQLCCKLLSGLPRIVQKVSNIFSFG
uniref:SET n=1 Tax=Swordtail adomavirus 2 TaxID=2609877 RepID=A0A6F9F7Y2_9VIRU|nr:TPA_asm: SET [Swordtail adomavirus 2]